MRGIAAIGCISDTNPQPLLVRSRLGAYAICTVGIILVGYVFNAVQPLIL